MNEDRVRVTSTTNATVIVNSQQLRVRREFNSKGAVAFFKMSDLEELFYEPGVEYLFTSGILYIEDMAVKIKLGLEEEGTEEPTNIISFNDKEIVRLMTLQPFHEFKKIIDNLSIDQTAELSQYVIDKSLTNDNEKVEYLSNASEIPIINIVLAERQEEQKDARLAASKQK